MIIRNLVDPPKLLSTHERERGRGCHQMLLYTVLLSREPKPSTRRLRVARSTNVRPRRGPSVP